MQSALPIIVFVVATGLKFLLVPAYHSTDFDVHRNWLAVTSSLPVSQWYLDATSEWTLDYPPFFAWFEWFLSLGAPYFDAKMLIVSAMPYASAGTVAYQRLTVMASDALLLAGASAMTASPATESTASAGAAAAFGISPSVATIALVVLNPGLLLVDHVHFQYNGMLIGLLLLACAALANGRHLWAAVAFSALLNLKHLFLFAAPLFFVYLLRHHVLGQGAAPSLAAFRRLLLLGSLVLAIFALSFGPFLASGQLLQLATRLFPFGRGLTHAYWAPNAWALYTFLDRLGASVATRVLPRLGIRPSVVGLTAAAAGPGGTSGVVGETSMMLLPNVGAGTAAALVLLAQAPVLLGTWSPTPRPRAFAPAIAFCGLAAHAFGYHVHEKAILPPLLVLTALAPPPPKTVAAQLHARLLVLLSSAGHYALLPLLYQPPEWALSRLLPLAYLCAQLLLLRSRLQKPTIGLQGWELAYLIGFVPVEVFCSFVHPLLLAPRMPFLPLMATSVYCTVGVLYSSGISFLLWREYARGNA